MTSSKNTKKKVAKKEESFSLISDATLRSMYEGMLGCRLLEEKARRRRSGKQLLSVPASLKPALGQEAVIVGTTIELRADDTITAPSGEVIFRPQRSAHTTSRKAQAEQAIIEARRNVIAFAASSAAQLTIGTGIALANKDHGTQRVVVAFGDADDESMAAWSEALHLAGMYQLPIIFVLRPAKNTSAELTISNITERARLAGVIAIPVDTTDAVAMYRVSFESIARARKCTGATLIVSTPYVVEGEKAAKAPDPIARMESYLTSKGLFSKKWKTEVLRKLRQKA